MKRKQPFHHLCLIVKGTSSSLQTLGNTHNQSINSVKINWTYLLRCRLKDCTAGLETDQSSFLVKEKDTLYILRGKNYALGLQSFVQLKGPLNLVGQAWKTLCCRSEPIDQPMSCQIVLQISEWKCPLFAVLIHMKLFKKNWNQQNDLFVPSLPCVSL